MAQAPFYLGQQLDSAERVNYDPSHLTTHGVVVGMTGSGKTGMALVLLEEALRAGVPVLAIDPKGDLGNLALTFPGLSPAEFTPWVDPSQATREGISQGELGARTAARWREGLSGSGLGEDDLRALRAAADVTVYTPGSTAGVPLNVLGSLAAPQDGAAGEALSDEVAGLVSGLLGLLDIDADPLTSREHILLTNIIERAWLAGKDLDLPSLILQVQQPPFRKLGVFDLDTFFGPKDRMGLAMRLNALVATPSFAPWLEGAPVDIPSLLWTPEGKPRAAVIYLSHLSANERQFAVTLLLSKVITWMQTQAGTSALRALVYMDEVYGFAPPSAAPPSKKPILTILKQARAFGVGLVLATQNPVDLDYKAMSNAGTWIIGRLQTERDKARIVEALESAGGDLNVANLSERLGGLEGRQFLLLDAKAKGPEVLRTRWALSFLRGPLTRAELTRLKEQQPAATAPAATPASPVQEDDGSELADDESTLAPEVAPGVPVRYLDPAAEWSDEVGAEPGGKRLEAGVVARVHLRFDDTKAGLDHTEEWEAVVFPLEASIDVGAALEVDYDARDFNAEPPEGARYALPRAKIKNKGFFKDLEKDLKRHLYREESVAILRNTKLKLYGRVNETEEAFARRCDRAAQDAADAESAKLRDKFEKRFKSLKRKAETTERKLERAKADQETRKRDEMISGFGSILGAFFGGKVTTRKVASSVRGMSSRRGRTARGKHKVEEAEAKLEDLAAELEELEAELADELEVIDAKWADVASEVESLDVGLERNDIEVDEIALVWVPVG